MGSARLHVIVPAGGAGTRLWPLSTAEDPKYFLALSGQPLLLAALDRLAPLAASMRVVTAAATAARVRDLVADEYPSARVLAEPSPKNSMPAIGWAAAEVEATYGPDSLVASFAADHVIADTGAFRAVVSEAARAASSGLIATIGIEPTGPATGYGYIEAGEPCGIGQTRRVVSFTEKPDAARAREYVQSGRYYWNAGMFIARAGVLLDALARTRPALARDLRAVGRGEVALEDAWPHLEAVAIDYAVAEPAAAAGLVSVTPADGIGWSDVGDYASLADAADDPAGPGGARVLGPVDGWSDSEGVFVAARDVGPGEAVYVLGIPDAIVVRAGGRTLITTRAHVGQIGALRERLAQDGIAP